jgi:hypothetical protein
LSGETGPRWRNWDAPLDTIIELVGEDILNTNYPSEVILYAIVVIVADGKQ